MADWQQALVQDVLALNAAHAAIVNIGQVKFSDELRKMCEQNKCGMYGSNWMCPPGVGAVEAYGIDVMALTRSCGIPYNNGKNTVSYISLILFNDH